MFPSRPWAELLSPYLYTDVSKMAIVFSVYYLMLSLPQVVLLCLLAFAAAHPDKDAKIANYQYGIAEDGGYSAKYVL